MKGVNGRVALVTGAGSADGIGFANAKLLREDGVKVAVNSTTDSIYDRLKDLDGEQNTSFAKPADLTHSDKVEALIEVFNACLGPIDILVNDAGMVQTGKQESAGQLSNMSNKSRLRTFPI